MSDSQVQIALGDEGSINVELGVLEKFAAASLLLRTGGWLSMDYPIGDGIVATVHASGMTLKGPSGGVHDVALKQVEAWIGDLRDRDEAPIQRFEIQGDSIIDHRDRRGKFPRQVAKVGGHVEWFLDAESEDYDLTQFKAETARTREAVGAFFVAFLGADAPERVDAAKTLRSVD